MQETNNDRFQINVRLDQEIIHLLDDRRVALKREMGIIPTRSEVVRLALLQYLKQKVK